MLHSCLAPAQRERRFQKGCHGRGRAFPGSSGVIHSGRPARGGLEGRGCGQQRQAPAGTVSGWEVLKKAVCLRSSEVAARRLGAGAGPGWEQDGERWGLRCVGGQAPGLLEQGQHGGAL